MEELSYRRMTLSLKLIIGLVAVPVLFEYLIRYFDSFPKAHYL